ncbi:hypothetical protein [Rhodopirellula sp. SWK7]|uniref:hypothetical protein n=1 Tax=Rhodopirellula sp. SWK7 TaxID=595460 RepID=UPI0011819891|nr:hypothetical protein [Rhodopirellula sp. SWK7]
MNPNVRHPTMSRLTLSFSLSLLVYLVGCMEPTPPQHSRRIAIVSSESMDIAKSEATSRLKTGPGEYERWERLHESVKSVLSEYGTVTWDPDPLPDFYFSGDWFHEHSDGYSICSSKPINKQLLDALPQVLAAHDENAILEMNGIEDPIEGLVIFATSTEVLVGWDGLDRNACEKRLRELGITID